MPLTRLACHQRLRGSSDSASCEVSSSCNERSAEVQFKDLFERSREGCLDSRSERPLTHGDRDLLRLRLSAFGELDHQYTVHVVART